jgi:hypothetical protein
MIKKINPYMNELLKIYTFTISPWIEEISLKKKTIGAYQTRG